MYQKISLQEKYFFKAKISKFITAHFEDIWFIDLLSSLPLPIKLLIVQEQIVYRNILTSMCLSSLFLMILHIIYNVMTNNGYFAFCLIILFNFLMITTILVIGMRTLGIQIQQYIFLLGFFVNYYFWDRPARRYHFFNHLLAILEMITWLACILIFKKYRKSFSSWFMRASNQEQDNENSLQTSQNLEKQEKYFSQKKQNSLCCLCQNHEINSVFLDCNHSIACHECSVLLSRDKCPICFKNIKSVVKIFK